MRMVGLRLRVVFVVGLATFPLLARPSTVYEQVGAWAPGWDLDPSPDRRGVSQ